MVAAAAKKVLDGFANELSYIDLEYDFANDAGAISTISLASMAGAAVIHSATVYVVTACTSSGSATVEFGSSSTDVNAFLDLTSGAVASLTLNAVLYELTQQTYIGASETIDMLIKTAALTAGKVKLKLIYEML